MHGLGRVTGLTLGLVMAIQSPGRALTLVSECWIDEASGRIVRYDDPAATTEAWPRPHRGQVVTWNWYQAGREVEGAVQVCAGGQGLRYSVAQSQVDAVETQLFEMIDSDVTYSLADLQAMLRAQGARAWRADDLGRCGCEVNGF